MINTAMRTYDYYTYGAPSAYGQPVLNEEVAGTVKIAINTSNISIQDNINYKDCSYIGLTYDKTINDTFVIQYNDEKLKVLYVNPIGRMNQVFLKNI